MLLRLVCSAPLSTAEGGVFALSILFLSVLSSSVLTSSTPGPAFCWSPEAGAGGVSSHLPSSQSQLSIYCSYPTNQEPVSPAELDQLRQLGPVLALGGGGRGGAVAGHELLQPAAVHLGTEYRYNNNNIDNSSSSSSY